MGRKNSKRDQKLRNRIATGMSHQEYQQHLKNEEEFQCVLRVLQNGNSIKNNDRTGKVD